MSRFILEISLNVLGIVFKELFGRYKDDNCGNLENKLEGND
jgi:hypothetical protein